MPIRRTDWAESTNLMADVMQWYNGTAVNQGWYLEVDCTNPNNRHVASFQNPDISHRPYLKLVP